MKSREVGKLNMLDEMEFDVENGALLYRGVRYLLIRPETIVGFQKVAEEEMGSKARDAMFIGGHTGGKLSAERYMKEFNLREEEILDFMCSMGTALGWGKMEWSENDDGIVVRVHNSPFAESYGEAKHGVCHLIEGVFAGIGEVFYGKARSEERRCRAMGDEFCEIVVRRG
jgi:predicted hydrocarbon binding protein